MNQENNNSLQLDWRNVLFNKRLEGELFEQYRERRRLINKSLKYYLRGSLMRSTKKLKIS